MTNPFNLPAERRITTYDSQGARIVVSVRRRPDERIPSIGGYGILPGRLFYTLDNGMILDTEDELVFTSPETDEVLREASLIHKLPTVPAKLVTEAGHQQAAEGAAVDHPLLGSQKSLPGVSPVE